MSFKGFLVTEENVTESSQVKLAAQLEQFCNSCNVFAKRGQKILQMGKRGKKKGQTFVQIRQNSSPRQSHMWGTPPPTTSFSKPENIIING